jgi:hypothetical protein
MTQQPAQPDAVELPSRADEFALPTSNHTLADNHEARLSRLRDYQVSSLGREDALQSNLGSINAGLMRVALWLEEIVQETMEGGPRTMERLQRISPAIETHLRVARQVDRFSQIELRAVGARKPRANDDGAARACLDASPAAGTGQSEDSER